jgi:hypothetical protein
LFRGHKTAAAPALDITVIGRGGSDLPQQGQFHAFSDLKSTPKALAILRHVADGRASAYERGTYNVVDIGWPRRRLTPPVQIRCAPPGPVKLVEKRFENLDSDPKVTAEHYRELARMDFVPHYDRDGRITLTVRDVYFNSVDKGLIEPGSSVQ